MCRGWPTFCGRTTVESGWRWMGVGCGHTCCCCFSMSLRIFVISPVVLICSLVVLREWGQILWSFPPSSRGGGRMVAKMSVFACHTYDSMTCGQLWDEGKLAVNQPQGFEVSEKQNSLWHTGRASALKIGMTSERTEDLMCHSWVAV